MMRSSGEGYQGRIYTPQAAATSMKDKGDDVVDFHICHGAATVVVVLLQTSIQTCGQVYHGAKNFNHSTTYCH